MKTIKIFKIYKTFEDYVNSPEYNNMWAGWQGKTTQIRGQKAAYVEFYGCYVEMVNPEEHFGQHFRLYNHYKINDGCVFLSEVSVGGVLALKTLCPVTFTDNEILIGEPLVENSDRREMIKLCLSGITLY